jgi:hypothetical protein
MAAQIPEVVPTTTAQDEPPPQEKTLELNKEKCIGLWECCTCAEEYNDISDLAWTEKKPYTTRKTVENGELVCSKCIKAEFTKALGTVFDHNFPARWGGEELNINDFESLFFREHDFRKRYEARRVESERVKNLDDKTLEDMVPEGLVRDVDFQRCAVCKIAIGLRDGCNHMTCTKCGHKFCYICGESAKEDSGHWAPGSCPRWGQPGQQNAIFDAAVFDDDEEDFAFEGDMAFDVWAWNILMQTTDAEMRALMQRLLMPQRHVEMPTAAERRSIINAMFRYQPEHGVTEREWQGVVVQNRGVPRLFIEVELNSLPGWINAVPSEFPTNQGVLSHPVGGVFNMVDPASKREAYAWTHRRQRVWHPDEAQHPENFAIFDIGPGDDFYEQDRATVLLDLLLSQAFQLTDRQIRFTRVSTMNADSLLVTITGDGYGPQRRSSLGGIDFANPLVGVNFLFVARDDPLLTESRGRLDHAQSAQDSRLRAQSDHLRFIHPDQWQVDRDATNATFGNRPDLWPRPATPAGELPAPPATASEAQGTVIGNGATIDARGKIQPLSVHLAEEIRQEWQRLLARESGDEQRQEFLVEESEDEEPEDGFTEVEDRLRHRIAIANEQAAVLVLRIQQARTDMGANIAAGAAAVAAPAEEDGGVPVPREEDDEEDDEGPDEGPDEGADEDVDGLAFFSAADFLAGL